MPTALIHGLSCERRCRRYAGGGHVMLDAVGLQLTCEVLDPRSQVARECEWTSTLSGPFCSPASLATQPNCAHRLLFYPKKGTYPYLSYDLS